VARTRLVTGPTPREGACVVLVRAVIVDPLLNEGDVGFWFNAATAPRCLLQSANDRRRSLLPCPGRAHDRRPTMGSAGRRSNHFSGRTGTAAHYVYNEALSFRHDGVADGNSRVYTRAELGNPMYALPTPVFIDAARELMRR
jgi:hypothetical protein